MEAVNTKSHSGAIYVYESASGRFCSVPKQGFRTASNVIGMFGIYSFVANGLLGKASHIEGHLSRVL